MLGSYMQMDSNRCQGIRLQLYRILKRHVPLLRVKMAMPEAHVESILDIIGLVDKIRHFYMSKSFILVMF